MCGDSPKHYEEVSSCPREIGILLPKTPRQHRTFYILTAVKLSGYLLHVMRLNAKRTLTLG